VQNNKIVLIFLVKFFGAYILLFLLYAMYLKGTQLNFDVFVCDPITESVAEQTKHLLNTLGYTARIAQHSQEFSMKLFINNVYVARIIEGCNSISILILFCSFILAFSSTIRTTFLFMIIGSLLIYIVNILRIAIISIAIYQFPAYQEVLHNIVFPLIIYGFTFLLWFIWVRKFSKISK
jgi:exosortase family protein XrtF